MSESLSGKIAWITGGSSGIGLASAWALARAGAQVVLTARSRAPLDELSAAFGQEGRQAHVCAVDVTDEVAVVQALAEIESQIGQVDILLNSAGLNVGRRSWVDLDSKDWTRVFDVNVNGTFHCTRAVLPGMRDRGGGLVVNVASWVGRFPSAKAGPAYNAAKSAVVALTQSLNMEEHRHGIRACAILPGETATPIMAKRLVPPTAEELAQMLQPEDVASAVAMVARLPARACVNELVISPTRNRTWAA